MTIWRSCRDTILEAPRSKLERAEPETGVEEMQDSTAARLDGFEAALILIARRAFKLNDDARAGLIYDLQRLEAGLRQRNVAAETIEAVRAVRDALSADD
jgi:hypothetical protein